MARHEKDFDDAVPLAPECVADLVGGPIDRDACESTPLVRFLAGEPIEPGTSGAFVKAAWLTPRKQG